MRIALRTRPGPLAGAVFAAALLLLLPLRLVLGWVGVGDYGLAAAGASGSVWAGRLTDARFGDAPLGDLDARLAPLPLLAGRARVVLDSRADLPGRTLHGAAEVGRHAFGVADLTASVDVGRLLAPLPVSRLDLDGVSARFRDEACEGASGRVRAVLSGPALAGVALPATLAGEVRCEGAALLLPLGGPGARATVRVTSDGRYRAELVVQPGDPAAAARLSAAGFAEVAGGWRLALAGRL